VSAANGYDLGEEVEAQNTQSEQRTGLGLASDQATRGGFDPRELLSTEFIDTATEIDVDRGYPDDDPSQFNLGEFLAAETSKQHQTGNITRAEWEYQRDMDQARFLATKCQFANPGGVGAKCTGATRRRMTAGQCGEYRELTADLNQQLQSGYEAISMARSKSIDAGFMKRVLETIAVTRSDGYNFESSKKGILARLTGGLFG
jgi:hypothetical protein